MQDLHSYNPGQFFSQQVVAVEDKRQLSDIERIVNPLNNLNHLDPDGKQRQWVTVQLEDGLLGTLIISTEKKLDIQPDDRLYVIFAKRGSFGRAQQTLVYIKNETTGIEFLVPPETVIAKPKYKYTGIISTCVGLLSILPSVLHILENGKSEILFVLSSAIGVTILFLMSKAVSRYLLELSLKNNRDKKFQGYVRNIIDDTE